MSKRISVVLAVAAILLGLVLFFKFSGDGSAGFLWNLSNGGKWLLPLISVAALLDSINPCAFSILLLTIAFLFSVGKLRSSVLKIGGVYIFGIFLVYVLIGLGIIQALNFFNIPHFMATVGAALLVVLGLINVLEESFPGFPIKLKIPDVAHHKMAVLMERGSVPTAFLLGALVGICEFPCTGGPYLMVLGLLHDSGTFVSGLGYLILYNLIFILPLVVILLIASDKSLLEKFVAQEEKDKKSMRLWSGVAMIFLGIVILII